jgi:hypothetical protein
MITESRDKCYIHAAQLAVAIQNNNLTIATAREDRPQFSIKAMYFCTFEGFYNLISLQIRNHKDNCAFS